MTFESREISNYEGEPIEGFKFSQGDNVYRYTSADASFTLPAGTFEPAVIQRSEMSFSPEDTGETIEITVARDNPIATLFIGDLPSTAVWVTIYRAHRGDEDLAVTIFAGRIVRVRFTGSEAILTGGSLIAVLNRGIPPLMMQTPCNHVLFSAECGLNAALHRDAVTIASVSGSTVTSADFALRADQWFRGGRIDTPELDMRFIANHVGDTIKLMSPLPGLAVGMTVFAYWGCDHLQSTCETKFANILNHLGWAFIPGRNPFDERIL
jgi:uncharacterized phage protein (TIGR02218 family)